MGRTAGAVEVTDALLLELIAEVRGLRADLRQQQRPTVSLSRADQDVLGRLLPAIGGSVGSELFSSSEILEHEAAALRVVSVGLNVKQLGRLFRRAANVPVEGYKVRREGSEAGPCCGGVQVPVLGQ